MEAITDFFERNGWDIIHSFDTDKREGTYRTADDLKLSAPANAVLSSFDQGIYDHQWLGIDQFKQGGNICISTSTSSGKTLIFHLCALEVLADDPSAKILAIYPLKALGVEQEVRWKEMLETAGLTGQVGRIDGAVPQSDREKILKRSQVVIMTPDVIHAWLLSKVSSASVAAFLENISLVVIDEAHTYAGVFGSNSAFLYRRLLHLVAVSGGSAQIIAASATIKNPECHLKKLTGVDFSVIGDAHDTSPKHQTTVLMVDKPAEKDLLSSLSNLMRHMVGHTTYRFITFVDSRKQTEYISAISSRKTEKEGEGGEGDVHTINADYIADLQICPYRSGYEEDDRNRIQKKLSKGQLRGVISTSALEMGIDIPHLNLGILVGIPNSATSFYQRIGRIGRHRNGIIIIVNNGSIQTESIFREPHRLMEIPLSESALYLENSRIQYIHALCLARQGGEDEAMKTVCGLGTEEFVPYADFPSKFIELCHQERIGEISAEFQTMKAQAGEDPNHVYPLRDIDVQYKVECRRGPNVRHLGTLSHSQVMREAYPGAVYYYQTRTFRIYRQNSFKHLIEARPEKKYTTKPAKLPTLIFPNLSEGNVIQSKRYGDLIMVECNLQVRESIMGYTETRGRNEMAVMYPLPKSNGLYFDTPRFTRNYFTTGVIITHPSLDNDVKSSLLAAMIYEAFFMVIPFERQDIDCGSDKFRADRNDFSKGRRFLSIFDQTYGSLRLTSRFLDHDVVKKVLKNALDIAKNDPRFSGCRQEMAVLTRISADLSHPMEDVAITPEEQIQGDDSRQVIVLPNSVGLNTKNGRNEEFFVDSVFYSPKLGLSYKGRHLSETNKVAATDLSRASMPVVLIPVDALQEIPGESRMGLYNLETGEIDEGG